MLNRSLLFLLTASLLLAGCATQRIPFNESEYTVRPDSGDKVVSGKVFLTDQLDDTQVGGGSEVILEPLTSYSNQWFEVSYLNNRSLAAPDRRYFQYILKTKADKEGNFTFEKVAPGEYLLSSLVKWKAATCSGNVVSKKIPIAQKISVAADATRVDGTLTKPFISPSQICNLYNQADWTKE
jgi:hypothetical protein